MKSVILNPCQLRRAIWRHTGQAAAVVSRVAVVTPPACSEFLPQSIDSQQTRRISLFPECRMQAPGSWILDPEPSIPDSGSSIRDLHISSAYVVLPVLMRCLTGAYLYLSDVCLRLSVLTVS